MGGFKLLFIFFPPKSQESLTNTAVTEEAMGKVRREDATKKAI